VGRARSSLVGFALLSGWSAFVSPVASAETSSQGSAVDYTAFATFTSDYIYRGISQSAGDPALQAYVEAKHKILYAGAWASSVDFGKQRNRAGKLQEAANLELSPYAGIRPEWRGISFDFGVAYYAYPDSFPSGRFDYVEFDAMADYTLFDAVNFHGVVWWSPNESTTDGELQGTELTASYVLPKVWVMSPTVSAVLGRQWGEGDDETYTYWNAGVTLQMSMHPVLYFDVRYWDTNLEDCIDAPAFQCGPRVVGSLTASF
jgi:uncharacterized protein (TIGR02001 family)